MEIDNRLTSFFAAIAQYAVLSADAEKAFAEQLHFRKLKKREIYLAQGDVPQKIAYISHGLLSYYSIQENGDVVIKRFFADNSFVASTAALITKKPGAFAIEALEDTLLVEFQFDQFKQLMHHHTELAFFWISYLEINWVAGKEEQEITLKYLTAKERYLDFMAKNPGLIKRLRQHHIAAYLGVTPTQLSRIRKEI
ncbi:Crp/Fnr family transcriptional regulator [Chitinophaga qingshengii]|uniref:Crp/Fnr family transcriptional regulator n=1 Tax=Chitinophaga qingshengii TaxID=1569794 RepID=A0ABR7TUN8_9BACT|nr:Crp/Fnr family transcriptional regulator [Chitinophaga qingshengii]MBC9933146.1 Crp/Fnr family transcriptional regulator [Chitinophaga qingshengii]